MAMTKEQKAQEQKWQAQDDARIMAQYQEIMNDKGGKNRALKEAKAQARDLQKRANMMSKVAGNKKSK